MTGTDIQTHSSHHGQDAHQQEYAGPERRQAPRRHPGEQAMAKVFIEGTDQRASTDRRRS